MRLAAGGLWVPSPGQSVAPPAALILRNRALTTAAAMLRARSEAPVDPAQGKAADDLWEPSPLSGSRVLTISGTRFMLPRGARVKRSARANTAWVNFEGETFVFSELGCLRQSSAERRSVQFELL